MEIISTVSGQRKIIFTCPINQLVKKRKNKDGSYSQYSFYLCTIPLELKKYLKYKNKIWYQQDKHNRILLSATPTPNEYTIKASRAISIPRKFFKDVEKFNKVLFIIDMNHSISDPYVMMKLI